MFSIKLASGSSLSFLFRDLAVFIKIIANYFDVFIEYFIIMFGSYTNIIIKSISLVVEINQFNLCNIFFYCYHNIGTFDNNCYDFLVECALVITSSIRNIRLMLIVMFESFEP